ncbi:hypothetical protein [Hyphomicrobium sp.]|uniref:hypothetical protein n=1 Tax=Hyphomicrobium sp. TaxID=82 RepID=UPI000FB09BCF|nr:hypothetical protein [Hyphomicrobium sp.]RUO99393.1 MAG: hypothetical protein EKK30_05660 [Hyphomicrobium sp.]
MTAFSRSLAAAIAASAAVFCGSAANALPVAKAGISSHQSGVITVGDRYDGRYHRRYYGGRNVVRAPFTRVESGRRTVVDAPFAHVYSGRHGTHVVAPFVDLWR